MFIQDIVARPSKLLALFIPLVLFWLLPPGTAMATAQETTGSPAITLNAVDMEVLDFLRFVHNVSGLSFVIAPDVKGRVTAVLREVPAEQALDAVLKTNGWVAERDGTIVRVMTIAGARLERESRRDFAQAALAAAPIVTCTYRLSYAHVAEVVPLLRPLITSRGWIVADVRSNMLIATDVPEVLKALGLYPGSDSQSRCYPK